MLQNRSFGADALRMTRREVEWMLKCRNCISPKTPEMCGACKRMQEESRWDWELDNGQRICRCPECGRGNLIGVYHYHNPYRYCPWCGEKMYLGEQVNMFDEEENDGRRNADRAV